MLLKHLPETKAAAGSRRDFGCQEKHLHLVHVDNDDTTAEVLNKHLSTNSYIGNPPAAYS